MAEVHSRLNQIFTSLIILQILNGVGDLNQKGWGLNQWGINKSKEMPLIGHDRF